MGLVITDRLRRGCRDQQKPNVEMLVGRSLSVQRYRVYVQVEEPRSLGSGRFDRGFLEHLPPRHPQEIGVTVGMPSRLEPLSELPVMHQEHSPPRRVEYPGRRRKMPLPALPGKGAAPLIEEPSKSVDPGSLRRVKGEVALQIESKGGYRLHHGSVGTRLRPEVYPTLLGVLVDFP